MKITKMTQAWIAKVAEYNHVTQEQVLSYLRDLSSAKKVMHHLDLVCAYKAK